MLTHIFEVTASMGEALLAQLPAGSRTRAQASVIQEVGHRPWPLPERSWFMAQTWEDLLFAHWAVPVEAIRHAVPPQLPVDTFEGSAWIGITPFEVSGFRLRGTLPVPAVSRFPEVNVRTYTTVDGRPGIYFLSLDAASCLAVAAARQAYRLPYFRARMSISRRGETVAYRSERVSSAPAQLRMSYRPAGAVFQAREGSLEHFLAERYCLYTLDERRRVQRADIHHPPWPLQPAEATLEANTMAQAARVELPPEPPLLHFAKRQDVLIWSLDGLDAGV